MLTHDKMTIFCLFRKLVDPLSESKSRPILKKICIALGILLLLLTGLVIFDQTVDRSGWGQKENVYYYRDFHGRKVTGWLEIEGKTYYFGEDNGMVTGWQEIERNRYYFSNIGVLTTGWETIRDSRYYFGADGILHTGWLELDGNRYYLESDGAMLCGWLELDGNAYYFNEDGTMTTGWKPMEEGTYYFEEDGTMVTGHITLDEDIYLFQDNGVMYTGWEETDEGLYYYGLDGIRVLGWTYIDEKLYFFSQDGIMQTGWQQVGEYRYYLQEDGSAAVGPLEIDGELYYFTPKGIQVVLVNSTHRVPAYYQPDLVTYIPWHQVDSVCLDPLTRMLEDCVAAGYPYTFNSAYRSIGVQQDILSTRTKEYIEQGYSDTSAYNKARQTVALPGTSEHHLGLAVDVLNKSGSEKKALDWLGEHCWEYGFILRYAADKAHITGIISEPWHFRYVGREVSMDMKDSGLCLEEYLGAVPIDTPTE